MPDPSTGLKLVKRLSGPDRSQPMVFEMRPDASARAALAEVLGISAVRKLRFAGRLLPEGKSDWRLEAELGATVVQPCSVTLEPVVTRIDEAVGRRWVADLPPAPPGETEMPEDDEVEPLTGSVDLGQVMAEALALALPPFPRAEGVELGQALYAAPGVKPMTDEEAKPMAGLADLRDRLKNGGKG